MKPRFFAKLHVIALALAAAHHASADDATWNGTTDDAWATLTNWSSDPNPVPSTGNIATFDNAGNGITEIDLGAGVTINSIVFDTVDVAAYTIGSGGDGAQELTLDDGGSITANSTINANQIFNAKLVLGTDGSAQSYAITNNDLSNTLTFAGGITGGSGGTAGTKILNVNTSNQTGVVILNGVISDGGATSLALNLSAVSGTVQVNLGNAENTYSGGTSIGAGMRLNVSTGNSLGGGAVTLSSGGQVYLNSEGTYANNFTIRGTGTDSLGAIRMGNGTTNTINGTVTLGAASSVGVDTSKSGVINGKISGAFGLSKVSAGALTFSNSGNDYTGTTTISGGDSATAKLLVSETGAMTGAGALQVGRSSSAGRFEYTSSATNTRFSTIQLGDGSNGSRATLVQNNGTITATTLRTAPGRTGGNTGNINISGGTFRVTGTATIGEQDLSGTPSTVTVSGTGLFQVDNGLRVGIAQSDTRDGNGIITQNGGTVTVAGGLTMAGTASGTQKRTAIYNLNGGTLNVNAISMATTGTSINISTFNFNGGTIKPSGASATFMQGLTRANVRNSGAIIDTNGVNITIGQSLVHSNISGDNATDGGLTKQGDDTLTLTGTNTYTGTTTIHSGTLVLGSTGSIDDSTALSIAAGAELDTTAKSSHTLPATVTFGIDGEAATSGLIDATDQELDIDGATVTFNVAGPLTASAYVLANYGTISGTAAFASATTPNGYTLNYAYNSGTQIALVQTTGSAYDTWIDSFFPGETDPAIIGKNADPDGDGANNLLEFALNGDPNDGSNNGLYASLVQDASLPAGNELTLIAAVRDGATFANNGSPVVQTATQDGVVYTIEGSLDLVTLPGSDVSHAAGPSDTAPAATGLPDLTGTDWKYHTFKLDDSEGLGGKGFLRAKIEAAP